MADPSYIVDGVLTDGEAWVALASTTLDADAANITFTSPADGSSLDWSQFMDLIMIAYLRTASAANSRICYFNVNGKATNAFYALQQFYGNGTAVIADTPGTPHALFPVLIGDTSTANAFSGAIAHFSDINSGKFKSVLVECAADKAGTGAVSLSAVSVLDQAPVTSIKIYSSSGDLKDESRIDLFGILPRMVA